MPTVLRINGYLIMIYLHDHFPAHVHVFLRGDEVIIDLNCRGEEPGLRDVFRMKARDARNVLALVNKHRELLCSMWKEIHGNV